MLIEDQIKSLQRIKAKIDLYRKVISNIDAEQSPKEQSKEHLALEAEHPELLKEFCGEVIAFCTSRVDALGNPKREAVRPSPMVSPAENESVTKSAPPSPGVTLEDDEPADPLRFLLKHKSLDNKKVQFTTKDGDVIGTVRGLTAPFVVVETDSGYMVRIKPKELKVI